MFSLVFAPFKEPISPSSDGIVKLDSWGVLDLLAIEPQPPNTLSWHIYTKQTGWYVASHGSHMDGQVVTKNSIKIDCIQST